jgi:hypothetical protein
VKNRKNVAAYFLTDKEKVLGISEHHRDFVFCTRPRKKAKPSVTKDVWMYGSSDSTKSPASGIATFSEPGLMSRVGESVGNREHVYQWVSETGAVEVPVFLRTLSCSNDTWAANIV